MIGFLTENHSVDEVALGYVNHGPGYNLILAFETSLRPCLMDSSYERDGWVI